jgi:arginyl-tRNA synthetase
MADPISVLAARLQAAFDTLEPGADPVVRPSDRADFQANGALPLAKRLGRNPREVAADVVARADLAGVADVEVAGPGFVNLTLRPELIAALLAAQAADERLGVAPAATPEVVVVDYSAPNVAKEMHVGHLRTTIIGDALCRLLGFLGHDVRRENHIGDWGTPFGMLIEHLLDLGEDEAAHELSVGDLDTFYRQARVKFEADVEFRDRSRTRVVLLQGGDPETLRLWRLLVDHSTVYFATVYERLGVLLTPDDIVGESFYNPILPQVVADLEAAGLVEVSDGATCVFPPGFTNREGEPLPLIVEKGGGGFNYATFDLACVRDRVDRVGATLLLYVVGAPQALHFEMVWKVCEMAGWLRPPARAVHVAFGSMLGADRKMFKTRSGDTVKLVDLLDEAVERAAAAVAEKNPDLADDERAAVARAVGIGAVKYADLSTDRVRDYVFDWDRMLAFEGNTAPYLQYAHARIRSILRRGEVDEVALAGVAPSIGEPAERALALVLLGFDAAVQETTERYAPHRLCTYLFDVASAFTTFYEACPVLRADEPVRSGRLALSLLTARVIEQGLALLGIEAPARM